MAEVIAGFGTLATFLQVIDFAAKVTSTAYELIQSGQGLSKKNSAYEHLAAEYHSLAEECQYAASILDGDGEHSTIVKCAKECQSAAGDLLVQFQKLKLDADVSGPRKVIDTTRKAARAIRKKTEIESRRKHLEELNGLLASHMLRDMWTRTGSISLATLQTKSSFLQNGAENVREARRLLQRKRIEPILDRLNFPELYFRERAIDQAWRETCRWALTETESGLSSWLLDGTGIFWVTGKAGSGKSTLMKHLYFAPETRSFLEKWSQGSKLVMARFYFWYAGTNLQKSVSGLLLSILYHILYEAPELAGVAFPGTIKQSDWTYDDLTSALRRIAAFRASKDHAFDPVFCFFVDGLDEFHGNHLDLIHLLTDLAGPNIKLCISSRPWPAFREAFETGTPSLKVEDLSKPDITKYVDDHVRGTMQKKAKATRSTLQSDDETESLITEIAAKAEGVFLWVKLVVRSVCQGISEGDDVSFLRYRVQCFPENLEEFFKCILERVDSVYHHQTSQALKLAWLFTREDINSLDLSGNKASGSTFLDYWFIRKSPYGLRDADFAYKADITETTEDELDDMIETTRNFLCASCKDLLCLQTDPFSTTNGGELTTVNRVEFLHRTVYDFLCSSEMQSRLDEAVPSHFIDGRIVHLLNLRRLKVILPSQTSSQRSNLLRMLITLSLDSSKPHADLDTDYVRDCEEVFLDHLDRYGTCEQLVYRSKPGIITTSSYDPSLGADTFLDADRNDVRQFSPVISLALESLVAFHYHDYIYRILPDLPFTSRACAMRVFSAALGQSAARRFDITDINANLISALIRYSRSDRENDKDMVLESAWKGFLCVWYSTHPPNVTSALAQSPQSRAVWDIAKLFLPESSKFTSTIFQLPDGEQLMAHEHLVAHVPLQWLREDGVALNIGFLSEHIPPSMAIDIAADSIPGGIWDLSTTSGYEMVGEGRWIA